MSEAEQYQSYAEQEAESRHPLSNMSGAYKSPIDMYGSQISVLTNPSDALYEFELFLRCLKEDENGNLVKIGGKYWKPMMNDKGINSILMSMHSIINNMTPLSNLDDWEIAVLIRQLGYNLVDDMAFNRGEFELNDTNRRLIAGAALRFCYVFLKRPYHEGDRRFFGKITHEVKQTTDFNKNKGGFSLNPFKMFGGK